MPWIINILGYPNYRPPEISVEAFLIMIGAMAFILFLHWLTRTKTIAFSSIKKMSLSTYTLNFDDQYDDFKDVAINKKVSLPTRIVLYFFALLVIFTPFYKLITIDYNYLWFY